MRQVSVVCVGKLQEKWYVDACGEYQKRLGLWCRCDVVEVPEYRVSQRPSESETAAAIEKEGQALLGKLPEGACLVALCVEGQGMDSVSFARYLQKQANAGYGRLAFVIGGSFGLSEQVKEKAKLRLSLSSMTFPHTLSRVVLMEQLYRAYSLLHNGKYHK